MLVYHIMPYVMDTPKSIFPRVPQNHMFSEDTKQPRICVSPSLDDCLTAIGLDFVGITFAKNIITTKSQNPISELTFPFVIRTYDITQNTESILHNDKVRAYVPDADVTHECWIVQPTKPQNIYLAWLLDADVIDTTKFIADEPCQYTVIKNSKWSVLPSPPSDILKKTIFDIAKRTILEAT